jgi:[ribosomal protein S5]-alanine N-acetyltransferase
MKPPVIVTERLVLRRPHVDDLDAMFEIMSNPSAMRYWSTLPHADRNVTRPWLDKKIARNAEVGEDYFIELDGRVIGEVGAGRLPDFGFMIHPDFWGRGFATEASTAFIAHAFRNTAASELRADVDPRNVASLRVLDRLGFAETGRAERTFLLGDEWCDSVYLALQRPA